MDSTPAPRPCESFCVARLSLLVVSPEPDHFDRALLGMDLVDQAILQIDATRAGSGEVTDEPFKGRRGLKWIGGEDAEQVFSLRLQTCRCQFLCISLSLAGEDDPPAAYQPNSSTQRSRSVSRPSRIDSRIPGIDNR